MGPRGLLIWVGGADEGQRGHVGGHHEPTGQEQIGGDAQGLSDGCGRPADRDEAGGCCPPVEVGDGGPVGEVQVGTPGVIGRLAKVSVAVEVDEDVAMRGVGQEELLRPSRLEV